MQLFFNTLYPYAKIYFIYFFISVYFELQSLKVNLDILYDAVLTFSYKNSYLN